MQIKCNQTLQISRAITQQGPGLTSEIKNYGLSNFKNLTTPTTKHIKNVSHTRINTYSNASIKYQNDAGFRRKRAVYDVDDVPHTNKFLKKTRVC